MQEPFNQPPIPPATGYNQTPGGPQMAPIGNNKMAAGLCGILLGALGVHKFILGYTTEGIIMLLVTLVGSWFTCGISGGVIGVIGLIEGIIYLTKSDQDFYQMYVANKKPWF